MNELRQPSSPLEVVNETLDETIIINGNRTEVDYHTQERFDELPKSSLLVFR